MELEHPVPLTAALDSIEFPAYTNYHARTLHTRPCRVSIFRVAVSPAHVQPVQLEQAVMYELENDHALVCQKGFLPMHLFDSLRMLRYAVELVECR